VAGIAGGGTITSCELTCVSFRPPAAVADTDIDGETTGGGVYAAKSRSTLGFASGASVGVAGMTVVEIVTFDDSTIGATYIAKSVLSRLTMGMSTALMIGTTTPRAGAAAAGGSGAAMIGAMAIGATENGELAPGTSTAIAGIFSISIGFTGSTIIWGDIVAGTGSGGVLGSANAVAVMGAITALDVVTSVGTPMERADVSGRDDTRSMVATKLRAQPVPSRCAPVASPNSNTSKVCNKNDKSTKRPIEGRSSNSGR
jgi:hypothetical protein